MRFAHFAGVALFVISSFVACSAEVKTTDPSTPTTSKEPAAPSPSASGTPKADSPPSSGGSICEQICAKGQSANCSGQATCVDNCEAQTKQIPDSCKDKADAANQCALQKATSWKCNSSGQPVVGGGCDTESNALVQCVLGGGGSSGGGGEDTCGAVSTGNAACDACIAQNCCALQAACASDTECDAILQCFSSCSDASCYTSCENAHPTAKAKEQTLTACVTGPKCGSTCN